MHAIDTAHCSQARNSIHIAEEADNACASMKQNMAAQERYSRPSEPRSERAKIVGPL